MSRAVKQKRAERTRRDVLDAAREIFTARGFADASMEEIAERAGVTRGPLYHYFDDKQDLFQAVYAEVERYLAEKVLLGIRSRVGPGASAGPPVVTTVATIAVLMLAAVVAVTAAAVRTSRRAVARTLAAD